MRQLGISLVWPLIVSPLCFSSQEGGLPSGQHFQGTLRKDGGELHFLTAGRSIAPFHQVRIPANPLRQPPREALYRAVLAGGQHLSGEIVSLDGDRLRLLPPWADQPIAIPRPVLAAVTQVPGRLVLLDEDFEGGLQLTRAVGQPALSDRQQRSGRQSLLLGAAGQSVEYLLTPSVPAGRLTVHCRGPLEGGPGPRWLIETLFSGPNGPLLLAVVLTGDGYLLGDAPGLHANPLISMPLHDWRRLGIDFTSDSFHIQVDDRVLFHSTDRGPGGPLRKIRLRCLAGPAARVLGGEAWFDDLVLTRHVETLPRPPGDISQDEIWLAEGDQLFGKVVQADRRTVEFQDRAGQRKLKWNEVRGFYLAQQLALPLISEGRHVLVELSPGVATEPDRLEGVLQDLDERRLVFQHPALGQLTFDRSWVRRLSWQFTGRRIDLDRGQHHLGAKLAPAFAVPRPEGVSLRRTFQLDAIPPSARLKVEAAHLQSPADGLAVARRLQRGGGRTEVLLNGKVVDHLNRHAGRSSAQPRWLTLDLPRPLLRKGDNVLELRQVPDPETGYESCLISGLTIEIPR